MAAFGIITVKTISHVYVHLILLDMPNIVAEVRRTYKKKAGKNLLIARAASFQLDFYFLPKSFLPTNSYSTGSSEKTTMPKVTSVKLCLIAGILPKK